MPRTARASDGEFCYHVINRGNARQEVFLKRGDYQAFIDLIARACERVRMRVLAYCLMPNHFTLHHGLTRMETSVSGGQKDR